MDPDAIRALLPWRPPFVMIDGMDACVPHDRITTYKLVSGDDPLLAASGSAVVPPAMVLEGMNQSAALLFQLSYGPIGTGRLPLLGYLRARFLGDVRPGDRLTYEVRSLKMTSTHGLFAATALVDGRAVGDGELGFAIAAGPSAARPAGETAP